MKKRLAIIIGVVCVLAACSSSSPKTAPVPPTSKFVTDLRAASPKAKTMTVDAALAWGNLVCVTFRNGGSKSDVLANIRSTNQDSIQAGEVPLDDVALETVIRLAVSDMCTTYSGQGG